jgi:DNA (cytosine-5)-methyltransferase 1
MKVLSLFSGVGGFDMGLENAGMETVFQCEWDKHANSILHRHWPDVPKWDDVSTLTGKHILANAPVVDVVAWGSPCQDLSVAGKRAGLEGGRSGLFHEGIRIIKELQEETNGQYPRISIWENVVGALNSNGGADFGVILDEMAEAGALAIEWSVLDAQYFGIPQRRRRVFVIAIFDPVLANRCPNPLLPVSESLPGHLAKGKPARKSAARTLTEGVGTDGETVGGLTVCDLVKGQTSHQALEQNFLQVVDTQLAYHFDALSSNSMKSSNPDSGVNEVNQARTLDTWRPDPSLNQGGLAIVFNDDRRIGPTIHGDTVSTLQAFMGTGGNNTPMVAQETELPMLAFDTQFGSNANVTEDVAPTLKASQQSPSVAYSIDTRNALAYDEYDDSINKTHHALRAGTKQSTGVLISPTLTAYNMDSRSPQSEEQQRIVNAVFESTMAVRRLTPLECERLMGWPDDHTRYKADGTEQADTHRYKQCGNGVASPVAQWIAKHILAI